jgi:hypothetical protein
MVNFDQEYDAYITTEIGTFSVGGVSFWVDNWIKYVVPHLRVTPILIIEVEPSPGWAIYAKQTALVTSRPGTEHKFEWKYPISSIQTYFSLPTPKYTNKIIKNARRVHLLSCPYTALYKNTIDQAIGKYGNIDSIVAHSVDRESTDVHRNTFHVRRGRELFDNNKGPKLQEGLNKIADETIWIGVDERKEFDHHIANFYKFEHNLKAVDSNIVGYAARTEARKNFHYLQNIESMALTANDIISTWETMFKEKIQFENVKVESYEREKVDDFYNSSDWGIFHGAYENEPFGYSIFQAIDYGKMPIISKDWCEDMDYPFRAGSVKEFEKQVAKIKELSLEERDSYLQQLKTYLSKFSSETGWRDELLTIYNRTEKETWLPGKLQPSI